MPASSPASSARRARRSFRVVAALGATLLAFAGLEIGLRVHHGRAGTYDVSAEARRARADSPWAASDDAELVYVNRPRKVAGGELRIESHGVLRPTEVAAPKPPGVKRLAVLGDSVGAALYLAHTERFPTLLERRLNGVGSGGDVGATEVLNFCVNGYDTRQEARLLETVVADLEPDAVLLVYCINDPAESITPISWFREPAPPVSFAARFMIDGILGDRGRPLAPGEGPAGRARPYWERAYDPECDGWAVVREGLDRVAAWRAVHDVPVLIAIAPLLLPQDPAGTTTAGFRAQVKDALDTRGLPYLDLQPIVTAESLPRLAYQPGDIYHFGAAGHAALADALLPHVRALLAAD